MKPIHVECKPDEMLVSKFDFTKKFVTHHSGKSKVFKRIEKLSDQLAMVDEDPGTIKSTYEKSLKFVVEAENIKLFTDKSGNKVIILNGKLEDWMVSICKKYKIDVSCYGLPNEPDKLHEVINQNLIKFNNLLDDLIRQKNPALSKLKEFLK